MSPAAVVAVVLAGGESSRFGSDKLETLIDGRRLLDHTLGGLPVADIVLVGPERATERQVAFVREDPPGGGPAAALIAGLCAVAGGAAVVVIPGDAPDSGPATAALLAALPVDDQAAVMAVAADGQDQPLQLALRPGAARTLVQLAGPTRGAGMSARRLVLGLGDALIRCSLPLGQTYDIDTTAQRDAYRKGGR